MVESAKFGRFNTLRYNRLIKKCHPGTCCCKYPNDVKSMRLWQKEDQHILKGTSGFFLGVENGKNLKWDDADDSPFGCYAFCRCMVVSKSEKKKNRDAWKWPVSENVLSEERKDKVKTNRSGGFKRTGRKTKKPDPPAEKSAKEQPSQLISLAVNETTQPGGVFSLHTPLAIRATLTPAILQLNRQPVRDIPGTGDTLIWFAGDLITDQIRLNAHIGDILQELAEQTQLANAKVILVCEADQLGNIKIALVTASERFDDLTYKSGLVDMQVKIARVGKHNLWGETKECVMLQITGLVRKNSAPPF